MKYLCLVYLEPDKFTAVPDRECFNCGDDLRKQGLLLSAEVVGQTRHFLEHGIFSRQDAKTAK